MVPDWVCVVCLWPFYGLPGKNGLIQSYIRPENFYAVSVQHDSSYRKMLTN